MFELVDSDGSGQIEFQEFLVAALDHEKLISHANLTAAFNAFDINGNGQINGEEILTILKKTTDSNDIDLDHVKKLIDRFDRYDESGRERKDEQLSRDEFFAMFGFNVNQADYNPKRQGYR